MDGKTELLVLTERLLSAIAAVDWATYEQLCDTSLTAFEPEAVGHLVEGLEFHRFYFDLGGTKGRVNTTLCSPQVRLMGDVGIVTYVRLNQRTGADDIPCTKGFEETRVWQRKRGPGNMYIFTDRPSPSTLELVFSLRADFATL